MAVEYVGYLALCRVRTFEVSMQRTDLHFLAKHLVRRTVNNFSLLSNLIVYFGYSDLPSRPRKCMKGTGAVFNVKSFR